MKKSLVLAMAMALGVTASAYAANPFSDVPAGHWAYDSISKLAAAGIIEGYGDDTFRGDRLMTRYEMAQIVAKALAKGANVDKLAAEFADELDALGVRVAALEKKSDNVKVTGQFRYHYAHNKINRNNGESTSNHSNALRSRIWFTGKVNDNWNYVGMLQNQQDLTDNTGNETTNFQRAYVEGRLGGVRVVAGRHDFQLGDANLYDNRMDGIKVEYGNKVKVGAYYGKPTDHELSNGDLGDDITVKYDRFFGANVGAEIGKFSLNVAYDKFKDAYKYDKDAKATDYSNDLDDNGVFSVQAKYNFGKAALDAIFLKSNVDTDKGYINNGASTKGLVVTASYGGAEAAKVGSWGLVGKYYNQGVGTFVAHTMNGNAQDFIKEGFKGYSLAGYVTVAKNMVAGLEWYDLKGKESKDKEKTLWSQLVVSF
ncbi:MAG: S-layer homology domain-containing protein [Succiniclasticum sp.]|uniref:S-layer homology domain-containing protein n=1 Tax=Succiniclasticum sp. TaxID=2775030 RepID=UPI002A9171B3|nr:S-layer homology domain-containing protein [Succiniclasticum sp.]MDY6291384.1 S-layer homology domain-containing protein [Succiniclasticum sp.]